MRKVFDEVWRERWPLVGLLVLICVVAVIQDFKSGQLSSFVLYPAVFLGALWQLLSNLPSPGQPWGLLIIAFVFLGVFAWQRRPVPPLFWFVVAGLLWFHTAR